MNQEIRQSEPESAPRREFLNSAEGILWKKSHNIARYMDAEFTIDELATIAKAWETLDPGIKDLALIAYPRIAAALLDRKLNTEG